MCNSKNFSRWCNNWRVVPTLKAIQKFVDFCHNKGNVKVSLYFAKSCNYLSPQILLFTESENNLSQELSEDMLGGLSFVFTMKAIVDETLIRYSARPLLELMLVNLIFTSLLHVSSNSSGFVHEMVTVFRILHIQTESNQEEEF